MKKLTLTSKIIALSLLGFTLGSCGNKNNNTESGKEAAKDANEEKFETKESEKKADFLVDAIAANMAEIQVAQLAKEKSANKDILALAGDLEKDHNAILTDLRDFAAKRGVTVPTEITADDAKEIQKLREEKQVDFDKKLLKDLEDRHKASMKKYEKCAEDAEDVELQNIANKHLVMIRAHHQKIENMLAKY